jgi:hypothetical protein
MRRTTEIVVAAVIVLFFAIGSGVAQEIETGRHGTLGCIGKHFFRPGEIELTNLAFRNFNSDQTVRITDITIFSDTGAILVRPSPFPGPFAVLGPHQSVELSTTDVFGNAPPGPASELFQIVVNWVSDGKGLALFGHAARLTLERNETTGVLGGVKARGLLRCVTLSLR